MNKRCKYCLDCTVDPELTKENDFSSAVVSYESGFSLMLSSGGGKTPRIEAWAYDPYLNRNQMVGVYVPRYCPECGRRLREESGL